MPDIEEILDSVEDFSKVGYKNGLQSIPSSDCTIDVVLYSPNGLEWENNQPLNNREYIQEALNEANFGDVVCLPSGRFAIGGSIYMNKNGVTLKGFNDTELWFYERNDEEEFRCVCDGGQGGDELCVLGYFDCSQHTDSQSCDGYEAGCSWTPRSKYINNVGPSEGIIIGTDNLQSIEVYNSSVVASSDDPNYIVLNADEDAFLEVGDEIIIEVFVNQNFVDFYDMSYLSSPTGNIENNETTDGWDTGWKNFTKRKISYIQNNLIYLDIPLRYEISPDIFSHLRIKKLTNYSTDIGLRDIKVSNSIYYDDAWKKDSSGNYLNDGLNLITMQNCIDCFIDNVDSQDIASHFSERGLPEIGSSHINPIAGDVVAVDWNCHYDHMFDNDCQCWCSNDEYGDNVADCDDHNDDAPCQEPCEIYCSQFTTDNHLLGRSTCPPQGIMTKIISKMGETISEEVGNEWFGNDLYSTGYIECSRDLRLFDFVLNYITDENNGVLDDFEASLFGDTDTNYKNSHTRHILSNGIKVENSKNITIQNSNMSNAELRVEGDNGKMFYINNSNEILIENCKGYRGRHNFSVGGWGTSGVVFSKIHSIGGWGFGFTDSFFDQLGLTDNIPTQLKYYSLDGTLTKHGILKNNKINEASGIVHSRQYDNVFWTHNDSSGEGDTNSIFAFNQDGDDLGEFFLTGLPIPQRDWEDMATDNDGNLYIGEIGDNNASNDTKYVYKCPEPDPDSPGNYTIECESYAFDSGVRYDSETLMVDTNGDIYVVTKSPRSSSAPSSVYKLDVQTNIADMVGTMISLPGIGLLNQVTGGDISPDGTSILIRTYQKIFKYSKNSSQTIAQALQGTPEEVEYLGELLEQAEAVAWSSDGNGYYTISEEKTPNSVILNYLEGELGITLKSFFDSDSDFWSRYGNIEIPSLIFGMPTYSNTSKAFSNSILVTDSDIRDGWMSANNETIDNNQGVTTTNTIFWNNNSSTSNSSLISFQPTSHNNSVPYENGGLIYGNNNNLNLYSDYDNPYEYLENWTDEIYEFLSTNINNEYVFGPFDLVEEGGGTISQDLQNGIFNIAESFVTKVQGELLRNLDIFEILYKLYEDKVCDSTYDENNCCHDECLYILDESEVCMECTNGETYDPECIPELIDTPAGICVKEIVGHDSLRVKEMLGGEIGIWGIDSSNFRVDVNIYMCNNSNINIEGDRCEGYNPFTFYVDVKLINLKFDIVYDFGGDLLEGDGSTLTVGLVSYRLILEPIGIIGDDVTTITGYDGFSQTIVTNGQDNIDLDGFLMEIAEMLPTIRILVADMFEDKMDSIITPKLKELFNTGEGTFNNQYILMLISLFGSFGEQTLFPYGSHHFTGESDTLQPIDPSNDVQNLYEYQSELPPLDSNDGDVNQDGIVNVIDIVAIVNHILDGTQLTDEQLLLADMNNDGIVNVVDIVAVVAIILTRGTMNRKEENEINRQLNRLINSNIPTKLELPQLKSQRHEFNTIVRTKNIPKPRKQNIPKQERKKLNIIDEILRLQNK